MSSTLVNTPNNQNTLSGSRQEAGPERIRLVVQSGFYFPSQETGGLQEGGKHFTVLSSLSVAGAITNKNALREN